jgi:NADPH:quinone reductase-like Zn-dependent oxidoreductase
MEPTGSHPESKRDRHEVQLSVEYTIVSGSDVNMRRGTYPLQRKPPLTPGYSVIGNVRLNGPGATKFAMGDCVACLSKYEGQSELINLPEQEPNAATRNLMRRHDTYLPELARRGEADRLNLPQ